MASYVSSAKLPVWLVTGTSNGLGLALARHVLARGHNLISVSRHAQPHDLLKSEPTTGSLNHVQLDLSSQSPETIKSAITNKALQVHNRVDVLVNMAGVANFEPLETLAPETLHQVFQVNCFSPLYIIQALLPHFRTDKSIGEGLSSKTVVNFSSTQGLCSDAGETAYDTSKHALESFSEVLSQETHNELCNNIRTLIFESGAFRTNLVGGSNIGVDFPDSSHENNAYGLSAPYSDENHPVRKRMDLVAQLATGMARGDPQKAAQIIFDAVMEKGTAGSMVTAWEESEEGKIGLPLRIILGADGWAKIDRNVNSLRRTVDATKALAHTTDLDE